MGKISRLPPEVVSKIAAGEVVENPSSVVKELIENSIDANSKRIKVYVEDGGKELIRVLDDGVGIPLDDVELAFERHATSKISSFDDLRNLYTLGFRGEALPSIAEVSRVELITRAREEEKGTRIVLEGGRKLLKEIGLFPEGTSVTVRSLFFNVPVRRNLLRSSFTEWSRILRLVISYILAFPEIEFYIYKDGDLFLRSDRNSEETLKAIFGSDFTKGMKEVNFNSKGYIVSGLLSLSDSSAGDLFILVNRRPVRDNLVKRALADALSFPPGKFPIKGFLRLEIPPYLLDQNIHPAKLEVRFLKPEEVYFLVYNAIRDAFSLSEPPSLSFRASIPRAYPQEPRLTLKETLFEYDSPEEKPKGSLIKVLAKSSRGYFLAETPKGIAIVDPHAVAERLLFEKLKTSEVTVQLTLPVVIQLDSYTSSIVEKKLPLFREIGLELDEFGKNTFLLRGVPSPLSTLKIEWSEIIKFLALEGSSDLVKAWADLACHAAPKLGNVERVEELQLLLNELFSFGEFELCPHGRPILYLVTYEEIEKWIRR